MGACWRFDSFSSCSQRFTFVLVSCFVKHFSLYTLVFPSLFSLSLILYYLSRYPLVELSNRITLIGYEPSDTYQRGGGQGPPQA